MIDLAPWLVEYKGFKDDPLEMRRITLKMLKEFENELEVLLEKGALREKIGIEYTLLNHILLDIENLKYRMKKTSKGQRED